MAMFPNLRRQQEDRPRPLFGRGLHTTVEKQTPLEIRLCLPAHVDAPQDITVEKQAPLRLHARPQAHVDTPQVRRTDWVRECGGPLRPLGELPTELKVGIIGGGAAGVRTAFEAVKAGCNVTLIEARDEVGGRARSVPMWDKNIGELGSMRFPPSEGDLYDLAEAFGYGFMSGFPDPGIFPTLVSYAGHCKVWDNPNEVPAGFETVFLGWHALVRGGFNINGQRFESPTTMAEWLQSPDIDVRMRVQKAWQKYINEFKNDTFLYGMQKIFSQSNKTPPWGKNWTTDDFDRFGKLGIGSGGFGAFFKQCFLSIMRIMPNLWDTNQGSFVKLVNGNPEHAGIRELWQSVYEWATERGLKTLLNTKATRISKQPGLNGDLLYTVRVENDNGTTDLQFHELFCNVTNNVATVDLDLEGQIFAKATYDAMEAVHMALTTKLFVKVRRSPYFDDERFPRVLLTDGNLPQAYCLDYGDPENIVVLLAYAWEEYSMRLQAQQDPELLFKDLRKWAAKAVANSTSYNNWANCLNDQQRVGKIQLQHWQNDPTARGAFTLALPGQDRECATLFYDFEKKEGLGPYLIGDSFSFGGGWTESALETAFNCFSAMLKRRGILYHPELAPVNLISSTTYTY